MLGRRGGDYFGSGYWQVAGFCERGNEYSGYIEFGEFID